MSTFFKAYRLTAMDPDEVIVSILVPKLKPNEYVEAYKQARRREDDLAIVNAAMRVFFEESDGVLKVADACIVYGGVGPTVVRASATEVALMGKPWTQDTLELALTTLTTDITLPAEAPGGMIHYRRTLTATFFYKFYLTVLERIGGKSTDPREASAIQRIHRPVSSATHLYEAPLVGEPSDSVGQPIPHVAAIKQVQF
jgi:xanthine dehydrogenase/oxidase